MNTDFPLTITESAAMKLAQIFAGEPGKNLRVAVRGGGCSGFLYDFRLEGEAEDGDIQIPVSGRSVFIDPISAPYFIGAILDYAEELAGAQFVFRNPQAKATCGCGNSFTA
jgi:iron-sulfur cluster insertion protein